MISSVPRAFKTKNIFIGCDANTMLSHNDELQATIGPCVGTDVLPRQACEPSASPTRPSRKGVHASPASNNVR
eukprot:6045660-Heterocapsa_arctica.AAC.1